MKWILRRGFLFVLALALCSCVSGGSSSGSGGVRTDYQFLYDHNAFELNGFTVRWESNTIKVFTANIAGAETAVNRWAGPVNFTFVGSPPADGITFSMINPGGGICGQTTTTFLNSGKITKAQIQIVSDQTNCRGGLANTLAHEAGHALGFFGHSIDGGLMDSDGGNSNITTQVKNFMSLLYSQSFGWNITPFLSAKIKSPNTLYDRTGSRTMVRVDY
jgi:hypothetical protein